MKMIAKCVALLAVVAQIHASGCGSTSALLQNSGSGSSPVVMVSSGGSPGFDDYSSGAMTRNLVGKGKYPVAMRTSGPAPEQQIPVTTSRFTAPVQERTVRLPAAIPAPRTVAHSCTCYKTILRPRVHQQIITVPTLQRYVETSHKPVVENIQYEALPINAGSGSGIQFFQLGSGSGSVGLFSGSSCGSQIGTIEIPAAAAPSVQLVGAQVPQVQFPQPVTFGSCQC